MRRSSLAWLSLLSLPWVLAGCGGEEGGGGATAAWHAKRRQHPRAEPAERNRDVNLDVGETVMIESWNADGTSSVKYRGANWVAFHRQGVQPSTGPHRVAELVGNRLLVDPL